MTTSTRRVVLTLLCSAMSASLLGAQGRPHYRAYQMGDDVLAHFAAARHALARKHIDASRAWRGGGVAVAAPVRASRCRAIE